jgi:hypothetical protein
VTERLKGALAGAIVTGLLTLAGAAANMWATQKVHALQVAEINRKLEGIEKSMAFMRGWAHVHSPGPDVLMLEE